MLLINNDEGYRLCHCLSCTYQQSTVKWQLGQVVCSRDVRQIAFFLSDCLRLAILIFTSWSFLGVVFFFMMDDI